MTLEQIAANLEAEHDTSYHDEGCNCFERLLAATRGEPDPNGEGYRWPIYTYTVAEPPQFGPITPWDYAHQEMNRWMAEALFRGMSNAKVDLSGLSNVLDNAVYFIGDAPDA